MTKDAVEFLNDKTLVSAITKPRTPATEDKMTTRDITLRLLTPFASLM